MKTILIVDDQPGIRLLLNEVLKKEGYHTVLAANGIEALSLFDDQPVDGVLLDMKIPGMNGLEILSELNVSFVRMHSGWRRFSRIISRNSRTAI